MRLWVLAIGDRMPDWVEAAVAVYGTRMPAHLRVEWRGLPLARRGRTGSPELWRREEGKRLLAATPAGAERVALDPAGRLLTSEGLARQVGQWLAGGRDVALWVGGPDGLDPVLVPDWRWSLSPLTLSHPVVRVVLAEQLYRGWSIHAGLPYHRGA